MVILDLKGGSGPLDLLTGLTFRSPLFLLSKNQQQHINDVHHLKKGIRIVK